VRAEPDHGTERAARDGGWDVAGMSFVEVGSAMSAVCEHPRVSVLLTAVAVRHGSADDVIEAMLGLFEDAAGVRVEQFAQGAQPEARYGYEVWVGAEANGWVTVHPHYLIPADGLAIALTRRLGTVSSATSIYEDVLWSHDLIARGQVLDRYVNLPGYFGPGEYGSDYDGDPDLVAETLGVEPSLIGPYFRQISVRRARSRLLPPPKAHASDRFDLLDGWVITDLWSRFGIEWGVNDPTAGLKVGSDENKALSEHLLTLTSS
jgi:hypothetical protein